MLKRFKWPRSLRVKRLLPNNLFGRALLILVLPMLLSQILIAHIFYDRHWQSVERSMANSVVGDLVWLYRTYETEKDHNGQALALQKAANFGSQLGIDVNYERVQSLKKNRGKKQFPDLYRGLTQRLQEDVTIKADDATNKVIVYASTGEGVLLFTLNRKTLTSSTTLVFMAWMVGSSLLLMAIAIVFLRNQVRPIVALAQVAEQVGLGQEVTDFKPRGASEVRRAGRAFLVMSERMRRHVQNRMEMLAGISHDLRTPLTRMKLELELAKMDANTRAALSGDIDDMGRMIDAYLAFARGDAGELAELIDLNLLLCDIATSYTRSHRQVQYDAGAPVELMLRPQAVRRALNNLIDNALRYGGGVAQIALELSATFVRIKITDSGPGIDATQQEDVFKPFMRLEGSRNTQTGGVGLGLTIARTVAQSHGGDITLENKRAVDGTITGLEVTMRLPRAVQN